VFAVDRNRQGQCEGHAELYQVVQYLVQVYYYFHDREVFPCSTVLG
jgi:hypothetical protein